MTNSPNPGSNEALDAGCLCPVLDNAHGLGWPGRDGKPTFWINPYCPLEGHGQPPKDSATVETSGR